MVVVMVVVTWLGVEVYHGAHPKKDKPAQVQRGKVFYGFAYEEQDQVCHDGHHQACCRYKLVGVHFAWVVYLG